MMALLLPALKKMSKEFDFKKAYKEIEEINEWFQTEEIDLDEALSKYERAVELIGKCKERLEKSKNKFEKIKDKYQDSEN